MTRLHCSRCPWHLDVAPATPPEVEQDLLVAHHNAEHLRTPDVVLQPDADGVYRASTPTPAPPSASTLYRVSCHACPWTAYATTVDLGHIIGDAHHRDQHPTPTDLAVRFTVMPAPSS